MFNFLNIVSLKKLLISFVGTVQMEFSQLEHALKFKEKKSLNAAFNHTHSLPKDTIHSSLKPDDLKETLMEQDILDTTQMVDLRGQMKSISISQTEPSIPDIFLLNTKCIPENDNKNAQVKQIASSLCSFVITDQGIVEDEQDLPWTGLGAPQIMAYQASTGTIVRATHFAQLLLCYQTIGSKWQLVAKIKLNDNHKVKGITFYQKKIVVLSGQRINFSPFSLSAYGDYSMHLTSFDLFAKTEAPPVKLVQNEAPQEGIQLKDILAAIQSLRTHIDSRLDLLESRIAALEKHN